MEAFIARQSILNRDLEVAYYELLFRDGIADFFCHTDACDASGQVMANSVLLFDVCQLTSGKMTFINFPRELLLEEKFTILPQNLFSIELLEDTRIDTAVIRACRDLKDKGYMLILDDFAEREGMNELIELADIIKIDVLATSQENQRKIINKYRKDGIFFLAEKVESRELFERSLYLGYEYFQGYFFHRPVLISQKDIPGYSHHYLTLMQVIGQANLDFSQIEKLIKSDISLSYKLLRYINSAFFGLGVEVKSIKHALAILGEREIRKWVCLLSMGNTAGDKPAELLVTSMLRARFCELLAPLIGLADKAQDFFLLGLFSMIDGVMDRPIDEAIREMPLTEEMKEALAGKSSSSWSDPLNLVISYETGDWQSFTEISSRLNCREEKIPEQYIAAVSWVDGNLATLT